MGGIVITPSITSRESESLKKYLTDISKIEPFESPEAEYVCAVKAQEGDKSAKAELVERNLRFVVSCAKQYTSKGVSLQDLINEGNIGMHNAADRFDPKRGFKFITYAVWYVTKGMSEFLILNNIIRLPNNKVGKIKKYQYLLSKLEQILERPATNSDVLEYYPNEFNSNELEVLNELLHNSVSSLDTPIGEDGGTLIDLVPNNSTANSDSLVIEGDMLVNINQILSTLRPMDRDIIIKLFGLDGGGSRTLEDVGDMYSMSRESIRQRKEGVFRFLKKKFIHNARDILND